MKDEEMTEAVAGFDDLGLDSRLVATLKELGYEEATPIQREAIPPLLTGRDVIGQAATGTGKTAAFALPMLQRIAEMGQGSRPSFRADSRPHARAGDAGCRGDPQVWP